MRIGAVLLQHQRDVLQSYEWSFRRALGRLDRVLASLERYEIDEIAIIRPTRKNDGLVEFERDVSTLAKTQSNTPMSFGGGIRSVQHLRLLSQLPVERLVFSSAFINHDRKLLKLALTVFGGQAIQCLLPVKRMGDDYQVFDCSRSQYVFLEKLNMQFIEDFANEIIIYDVSNEGHGEAFDFDLLTPFSFEPRRLVISGGVGPATVKMAHEMGLAAALIENRVLYKEYSVRKLRRA